MQVVKVEKQKKHMCEITLDNGETFLLDSTYTAQNCIHTGVPLCREEIKMHTEQSQYKRALSYSVWYIERYSASAKKLGQKLKSAGYNDSTVKRTVARMCELGLIDDCELARRLSQDLLARNVSKREALYKIVSKGIPRDVAAAALEENECDETAQIKALVAKKYAEKIKTEDGIRKTVAALARKGFAYGSIKSVLSEYSEELKYSEE